MIITGIPNGEIQADVAIFQSTEEKVTFILSEVCDDISVDSYQVVAFPPAENRNTHVCKVIFKEFEVKMDAMKNAKKLKNNEALNKIFFQWDEPKLTRQENHRLRKKKRELKEEYPDDKVEIKKGILKRNDQQVDKFNLVNQIF